MSELADLAGESLRVLDQARYVTRATDEDAAWSQVGSMADYLHRILDLSQEAPPLPVPPPAPAVQFVAPLDAGAVYGQTKWLPGSLGCDLFCRRGSPVYAPADCIVEELIGGTGLQGGAEMILALPDKSWAWRYRHVQAMASVGLGQTVLQGRTVAVVNDDSLNILGNPPAWAQPMPDRYQHLDLSVARGTDQFAPTGGGGGNYSAYKWLQALVYVGRVLGRTPGPPDAGFGFAASRRMMGRPA